MKVGDLVIDKMDNDYYIIIDIVPDALETLGTYVYYVYRIIDEHIDTRWAEELEASCK